MTPSDASDQGDSPAPADALSKEICHLKILAWVAVVLTTIVAIVKSGSNPAVGWVFVGLAVISIGCACAALARAKKNGTGLSPVIALVVSVGLLIYALMGILGEKGRNQMISHAGNGSTLSGLEAMLEQRFETKQEFPEALSDLEDEAKLFPDASIADFLNYVDPQTGEENAWIYERTSATECSVKSGTYKYEGKDVVLELRGKGGEVERVDE